MKRVRWVKKRCIGYSSYATAKLGNLRFCVKRTKGTPVFRGEATSTESHIFLLLVYCPTALAAKRAIVRDTREFLEEALETLR